MCSLIIEGKTGGLVSYDALAPSSPTKPEARDNCTGSHTRSEDVKSESVASENII
jgi:hypothetical protein